METDATLSTVPPCPNCGGTTAIEPHESITCFGCNLTLPASLWLRLASAARLAQDLKTIDAAAHNIYALRATNQQDAWIVGTNSADVDVIKSASLAEALTRLAAALGETN